MINHLWVTLGLTRMTQFDVVVLIGSLYIACAFTGVILDLLLTSTAFGAVINGFLLFVFLLMALVGYSELIQQVRLVKEPAYLLGISFGISCFLMFLLAWVKNRLSRID